MEKFSATGSCSGSGSDSISNNNNFNNKSEIHSSPNRIDTGIFSKIPPELFTHMLKFLSSEVR